MFVYYINPPSGHFCKPVMANGRPVLVKVRKAEQYARASTRWGYTYDDCYGLTAQQRQMRNHPDYRTADFNHKVWHRAKRDHGMSQEAAIIIALPTPGMVGNALRAATSEVTAEVKAFFTQTQYENVRQYCKPFVVSEYAKASAWQTEQVAPEGSTPEPKPVPKLEPQHAARSTQEALQFRAEAKDDNVSGYEADTEDTKQPQRAFDKKNRMR